MTIDLLRPERLNFYQGIFIWFECLIASELSLGRYILTSLTWQLSKNGCTEYLKTLSVSERSVITVATLPFLTTIPVCFLRFKTVIPLALRLFHLFTLTLIVSSNVAARLNRNSHVFRLYKKQNIQIIIT